MKKIIVGLLGVIFLLSIVNLSSADGEKAKQEEVEKLIAEFEKAFQEGPWERLATAVGNLRLMGSPAVPKLVDLFKDRSKNPALRKMSSEILMAIGDKQIVRSLIEVLEDKKEEPYIRIIAANVLSSIPDKRVVEPLIRALGDENKSIRRRIAVALSTCYLNTKDERIIEPLLWTLYDEDEKVRGSVAYALGRMECKKAVEPLLRMLENEKVELNCGKIIRALGDISDKRALEPLIKILRNKGKGGSLRFCAVEALGKIKDTRAVEPLIEVLEKEIDALEGKEAGIALGEIGDSRAVGPLKRAIEKEKDDFHRGKLKEAYKKLTGEEYKPEKTQEE